MVDEAKISAVRKYLSLEFPGLEIRDHYDAGRKAQCFETGPGGYRSKAIISREFLEHCDTEEIPAKLKSFLLAEHLKECNMPIIVTSAGLSAE
jgi:hypothetical protein